MRPWMRVMIGIAAGLATGFLISGASGHPGVGGFPVAFFLCPLLEAMGFGPLSPADTAMEIVGSLILWTALGGIGGVVWAQVASWPDEPPSGGR